MQPSKPEVAMRSFVLLPFLFITSCAPDERMPLSECDYGLYWAECGGDGEPVLGCDRGNGDCRWFSGGVTARGYAVADKPVLGGCPEGWPFSDFGPDGRLRERVVRQMSFLSRAPVERESANDLPVVFDLAPPYPTRCNTGAGCLSAQVERVGTSILVASGDRTVIQLEILPGETRDAWTMRLYRSRRIGSMHSPVILSCLGFDGSYLTSGTLHLNTDDLSDLDALHGRLEGVGERGDEVTFEF
jgi:hypothetical protein